MHALALAETDALRFSDHGNRLSEGVPCPVQQMELKIRFEGVFFLKVKRMMIYRSQVQGS